MMDQPNQNKDEGQKPAMGRNYDSFSAALKHERALSLQKNLNKQEAQQPKSVFSKQYDISGA